MRRIAFSIWVILCMIASLFANNTAVVRVSITIPERITIKRNLTSPKTHTTQQQYKNATVSREEKTRNHEKIILYTTVPK
ncbi:MAG: hypothetical protein JSW40_01655 [Candidatus Omnitrophota bacterium]|nr:MAG: hypothetical protein JSW40_01655 [Candidatus Omnitrophota bacterium]